MNNFFSTSSADDEYQVWTQESCLTHSSTSHTLTVGSTTSDRMSEITLSRKNWVVTETMAFMAETGKRFLHAIWRFGNRKCWKIVILVIFFNFVIWKLGESGHNGVHGWNRNEVLLQFGGLANRSLSIAGSFQRLAWSWGQTDRLTSRPVQQEDTIAFMAETI